MSIAIDLRSDTVTVPSPSMRAAMARAEVADDVIGHDPTMALLEERVAAIVGTEAALWVPTGSMSNLIGLSLHLERGDQFLAPRDAHVVSHELGTAAWFAEGMPRELPWSHGPGVPALDDVLELADPAEVYYNLRTVLLSLENTHNHAGGTIIPPDHFRTLVEAAHAHGLAVHLDGARIWHAAAALGLPVSQVAAGADTVSVCLSKGLGAPMGSVLCSTSARIVKARRLRKMLGGGVRQGGVVAAAGLVALDEELPRIDQDRVRAVRLAERLSQFGLAVPTPQTNIILIPTPDPAALAAQWTAAGVGCGPMGPAVRLVTHRDIDDDDVDEAFDRIVASYDTAG